MKLLVILITNINDKKWKDNIKNLNNKLKNSLKNVNIDYCNISSNSDLDNYSDVISFKYKIIDKSLQFDKISKFITDYKSELNYDWFIKFRPELILKEPIDFNKLSNNSINARARSYIGPLKIKNGAITPLDIDKNLVTNHTQYSKQTKYLILDDQMYIFHKNVIDLGGFNKVNNKSNDLNFKEAKRYKKRQDEWIHSGIWNCRNINQNIIGLNIDFTGRKIKSCNVNM